MCYILNLIWYRYNLYCILFCKCYFIYIMLIVYFLFFVKCKMLLNKFIYIKFKKGFMLCCIFVLNKIYVRVVEKIVN